MKRWNKLHQMTKPNTPMISNEIRMNTPHKLLKIVRQIIINIFRCKKTLRLLLRSSASIWTMIVYIDPTWLRFFIGNISSIITSMRWRKLPQTSKIRIIDNLNVECFFYGVEMQGNSNDSYRFSIFINGVCGHWSWNNKASIQERPYTMNLI